LADDDEQRRRIDEPGDDRGRQQIDDAAHLRQPQQQKKNADFEAQHGGDTQIVIGIGVSVLTDGGGDHEGGNGHRTHHQLPR
jgi:hypothetical protein